MLRFGDVAQHVRVHAGHLLPAQLSDHELADLPRCRSAFHDFSNPATWYYRAERIGWPTSGASSMIVLR